MISPTYNGPVYDPGANTAPPERSDTETGMGQDAFMKMFLAQVTNQDPMNPMDNTEFTAQLATFSQLEQLTNIANSMEGIARMEAAIQQNTTMSYIGREVTIAGNKVPLNDGQAGTLSYNMEHTGEVRVVVTNESGITVYTEELGLQTEGRHEVTWDGTDSWGETLPDGTYTISLMAYDTAGEPIGVTDMMVSAMCTGYETDEMGNSYLLMGTAAVPVDQVLGVRAPANGSGNEAQASSAEEDSTLEEIIETVLKVGGLAAALL